MCNYTVHSFQFSRSFIPSRLTKLHQTLVVKREWAGLVLPSGTGWESPVTIFLLLSFLLVSFNTLQAEEVLTFFAGGGVVTADGVLG